MMIKYPIHKVAKDFKHGSKELPSKEVMDIPYPVRTSPKEPYAAPDRTGAFHCF